MALAALSQTLLPLLHSTVGTMAALPTPEAAITPMDLASLPLLDHGLPKLDLVLDTLRTPAGTALFVPLYALWVTLLLPGVWASMLAGALYGTVWGSLLVFIGACLGAEAAFLLGRTLLRDWARRQLQRTPKLLAIEQAVSREGLRLVLLTRLSPAFPFSLLNLAYGLSEVSLRDYNLGLIAILPGTVLFCGLGALAGDVARFGSVLSGQADAGTWMLRLVGLLSTLAVVWIVSRAARQALEESPAKAKDL